jgi:hypothetical protein
MMEWQGANEMNDDDDRTAGGNENNRRAMNRMMTMKGRTMGNLTTSTRHRCEPLFTGWIEIMGVDDESRRYGGAWETEGVQRRDGEDEDNNGTTSQGGTTGMTGKNVDRNEEGQQWDDNNNDNEVGGTMTKKRPKGHRHRSLGSR